MAPTVAVSTQPAPHSVYEPHTHPFRVNSDSFAQQQQYAYRLVCGRAWVMGQVFELCGCWIYGAGGGGVKAEVSIFTADTTFVRSSTGRTDASNGTLIDPGLIARLCRVPTLLFLSVGIWLCHT